MKNVWKLLLGTFLLPALFQCSRPVAEFAYSGDLTAPAEVQFDNRSREAERYVWHFGDGDTAMVAEPSHRYRSSGNYPVRLEAFRGKRSRSTEQIIQVVAPEKCLVELETEYGVMLIELSDATPRHRDNFLKLVEEGYYDGLLFHRVIDGFMIQGGDPQSKGAAPEQALGMGGPGYTVPAEFVDTLIHVKGALAAARQGDQVNPEQASSGSQFYIVQGREVSEDMLDQLEARNGLRYGKAQREAYIRQGGTPFLDNSYTVFGKVIEGLEVIDKIATATTDARNRPLEDISMKLRVIK
jgi:peptidyl-prolyl cis-trans isomerase B (cyclophilin B)